MSRSVSITARRHAEDETSDQVEVLLMQFEHDDLTAPIRISSDPTERLSTDPLRYGTRSTWNDADPATEPYQFFPASFEVPGDQQDAPATVRLVLDLFDASLVTQLRSVATQATAHLAVVLAGSPDDVEIEYRGLLVTGADYGDQLTITASRKPIEEMVAVKHRFTSDRFPGLFS